MPVAAGRFLFHQVLRKPKCVGSALLVIWIFIVVSHLRLRPRLERAGKLTVRMWLFPWLSYATLALLGGFVVLMLFDTDARTQLFSTCVLFLAITALAFLNARYRRKAVPATDPGQRAR
jgi:aromatic amino acid permease